MSRSANSRVEVRVGLGSCGIANGAQPVWEVLREAARQAGDVDLVKAVGCGGNCHREPLVEVVDVDGRRAVYTHVTPGDARFILQRHVMPRRWPTRFRWTLDKWSQSEMPEPSAEDILETGTRIVLENCGEIDPNSLDEYRSRGGYEALQSCRDGSRPEDVIEIISAADLRGRGGAGFPTGRKWGIARQSALAQVSWFVTVTKAILGHSWIRLILESDPHRVVEGLAISAWAVGAEEGFFYIRAEYPLGRRQDSAGYRRGATGSGSGADSRCRFAKVQARLFVARRRR